MRKLVIAGLTLLLPQCHSRESADQKAASGETGTQVSRPSDLMHADIDPFVEVANMTRREVIQLFGKMQQADQQYRDSLYNGRKENIALFNQKILANDEANLKILNKIIQAHGWPKKSTFGDAAAETAWLIIWHHRDNRHILCQYVDLMEKAVKEKEMSASAFQQIADQVKRLSPDEINH